MIVRVLGQGQYEVPDDVAGRLNELDNEAVAAVEAGDEARFRELFDQMHELVRTDCSELPDDELAVSEVIIPPSDLTFEEARGEFTGDGLIPD